MKITSFKELLEDPNLPNNVQYILDASRRLENKTFFIELDSEKESDEHLTYVIIEQISPIFAGSKSNGEKYFFVTITFSSEKNPESTLTANFELFPNSYLFLHLAKCCFDDFHCMSALNIFSLKGSRLVIQTEKVCKNTNTYVQLTRFFNADAIELENGGYIPAYHNKNGGIPPYIRVARNAGKFPVTRVCID